MTELTRVFRGNVGGNLLVLKFRNKEVKLFSKEHFMGKYHNEKTVQDMVVKKITR